MLSTLRCFVVLALGLVLASQADAVLVRTNFTGNLGIGEVFGGADTPGGAGAFVVARANNNPNVPLGPGDIIEDIESVRCAQFTLDCQFPPGRASINTLSPHAGIGSTIEIRSGQDLSTVLFTAASSGGAGPHTGTFGQGLEIQILRFNVPSAAPGTTVEIDTAYNVGITVTDNTALDPQNGGTYDVSAVAQLLVADATAYDGSLPDTTVDFALQARASHEVLDAQFGINAGGSDIGADVVTATFLANTNYFVTLGAIMYLETRDEMAGLALSANVFSDPTFVLNPDFAAANPAIANELTVEKELLPDAGPECGAGGADCTDRVYGLGNDALTSSSSTQRSLFFAGPACSGDAEPTPVRGQITLRENESEALPRAVEIPADGADSKYVYMSDILEDLGASGLVVNRFAMAMDLAGSLGRREIAGRCMLDADERCGVDAECPAASGCMSSCAASGGDCTSDAECDAVLSGDTCRTRIVWDPDDSGPEGELLQHRATADSAHCCQSGGGFCSGFFQEYPALAEGSSLIGAPVRRNPGTWTFEGGAGTNWELDNQTVPGQTTGVCEDASEVGCVSDADCATTCDFSERGLRLYLLSTLPSGDPNPNRCNTIAIQLRGSPNSLCSLSEAYSQPGDPQPGCAISNFGAYARPDSDCNGLDDTTEGRCSPDGLTACSTPEDCAGRPCITSGDTCAFYSEENFFADANADGRGDECQCGDISGDGAITGIDIAGLSLCTNGVFASCNALDAAAVFSLADTDGDSTVTANDVAGAVAAVRGQIATTDLICVRDQSPIP